MKNKITSVKLNNYLNLTEKALTKIKINKEFSKQAEDILDMAKRYFRDANYYKEKGDFVTAFAAVNYAHAWLDAGARAGIFEVNNSENLFCVD